MTILKVFASVHKGDKTVRRTNFVSNEEDFSLAINECLSQIYKELDISEPVWLKKHARELSRFRRTKFRPDDFMDYVNFDFLEIEVQHETP